MLYLRSVGLDLVLCVTVSPNVKAIVILQARTRSVTLILTALLVTSKPEGGP